MELFQTDGHLTNEGLQAVIDGGLNELESLEASEHLGFCGLCLERYLTLMDDVPLLEPAAPIKDNVMRRIGRKAKRVLFSRYATVAAAACLTLVLWGTGFFSALSGPGRDETLPGQAQTAPGESVSRTAQPESPPQPSLATQMNRAAGALPEAMNDLFGWMSPLP